MGWKTVSTSQNEEFVSKARFHKREKTITGMNVWKIDKKIMVSSSQKIRFH